MEEQIKQAIRSVGGIVHSDGNIFFTNAVQFMAAMSAMQPKQSTKPLHNMPAKDDEYWLRTEKSAIGMLWLGDEQDRQWFREGRCYSTEEEAMAALNGGVAA